MKWPISSAMAANSEVSVIVNYSRQCLATEADEGIQAEQVGAVMERLRTEHRMVPQRIQIDNGSEFIFQALNKWACNNPMTLLFSRPGKPAYNAFRIRILHFRLAMKLGGGQGDVILSFFRCLSNEGAVHLN